MGVIPVRCNLTGITRHPFHRFLMSWLPVHIKIEVASTRPIGPVDQKRKKTRTHTI